MARWTLLSWLRRGWVNAYQQPSRRWVIRADPAELAPLKRLYQHTTRYTNPLESPFAQPSKLEKEVL